MLNASETAVINVATNSSTSGLLISCKCDVLLAHMHMLCMIVFGVVYTEI